MSEAKLTHSEGTLRKVYEALDVLGITGDQAVDVINEIMNRGIVFREVVRDD